MTTAALLPAPKWADHCLIAREASLVPVTPETIPQLTVVLGLTLGLLGRDLLIAAVERDMDGRSQ
jgi:hypothetical protein